MNQTTQLIETLKQVLRGRSITYAQVAQRIGMSEASVKRLFAQQSFTLKRLESVCKALEIEFFDLVKMAHGPKESEEYLTPAQEQALAEDSRLLAVFYLLYNEWKVSEIQAHYEITAAECVTLLARLEKLGIIDVLPNSRVRLRVNRALRLRKNGAIRQQYGERAMEDFLSVRFQDHGGHFRFEFCDLSKASFEAIKRKIDRLAAECTTMAEMDNVLPSNQRQSIGIGLGVRPWRISLVTGLKERKAG